jgi:hypothetical protein
MISTRTLLIALSAFLMATTTSTNAFVHTSVSKTFGVVKSSALNMLADDPKVVLVTGSSRGLGKSIALDIGSQGHKIVVNYVSDSSKESADQTVQEIKAAGGDAVAIQADCKCTFRYFCFSLDSSSSLFFSLCVRVCVFVCLFVCLVVHTIYLVVNGIIWKI